MNKPRCRVCNSVDETRKWNSKTLCSNCYQIAWMKQAKRKCVSCSSTDSKSSWYRGPKCDKCYHKEKYKKSRGNELGQKYCKLVTAARKKGFILDISKDEYKKIIDETCYYCGYDLYYSCGYSLDRIDGNSGYTKDNVVACCGDCNTIKNSILTKEETIKVVELIKKLRNTEFSPWRMNEN